MLAEAPFALLSTIGAGDQADASPRGDPAGFIRVLDDRRVLIPDRPGNHILDSFRNLLHDPQVAVLVPRKDTEELLELRGCGSLTSDPELLGPSEIKGKVPLLGLIIQIDHAELVRSQGFGTAALWDGDGIDVPPQGLMIKSQYDYNQERVDWSAEDLEGWIAEDAADNLY